MVMKNKPKSKYNNLIMKSMNGIEMYRLKGGAECKKVLTENPDYKLFWRSGFTYRGAAKKEIPRIGIRKTWIGREYREATFEEEMQAKYNWAAAIDIEVDHDNKEIYMNGFSENDMF